MGSKKKIKKRNIRKYLIIGVFFFIFFFGIYEFLLAPQIQLKGNKTVIVDYNKNYQEKGYTASFLGKNITNEVIVKGKVNEKKLGKYKITYKVKKGFLTKKVIRVVEVKDREEPTLNIDESDIYLCPGDEVVPEKGEAKDNYDGDLSDKIEFHLSKDNQMITYSVTDSSGNKKEVSKKIFYKDIESPVITLKGNEEMNAFLGDDFKDPGVEVSDNCDNEIEKKLTTTGQVDINRLGEYSLTYQVEDNFGNKAEKTRKVTVRKKEGTIYLTFDDGPNSGTTNVILDILKEEQVPATFFVTGKGPDELIKREYDEGHTVALHTNSHNYEIVYASREAYFNDLYTVQQRVKRITGYESKIIRFPGGSSNTVSRKYTEGIMSYLVQEVQNRGFRYYDWNISSGDAGSTTDPSAIYSNVVNNLRRDRANVVLMHDIKPYTRDALRDIIRYGKENGYTFKKITMDTPMVTQKVNN